MPDNLSKEQRSYTMSRIKSRGNETTEQKAVGIFRKYGIKGWRKHVELPGKPDFIFRKHKIAVFIDGCFWHGCPKCGLRPKSNEEYWTAKIEGNRRRDKKAGKQLRKKGWSVLRLWEHSLKDSERVAKRVQRALEKSRRPLNQVHVGNPKSDASSR
jgi:DNA mismatch endonuclease (patch repair protein)